LDETIALVLSFSKTVLILGRSTVPMKLPELAIQKSIPMSDQRRVWRTKAVLMSDRSKRQVIKFGYRRLRARSIKRDGSIHFFMPLIFVNKGLFSNRSWDCHGQWFAAGVLGHFLGAI